MTILQICGSRSTFLMQNWWLYFLSDHLSIVARYRSQEITVDRGTTEAHTAAASSAGTTGSFVVRADWASSRSKSALSRALTADDMPTGSASVDPPTAVGTRSWWWQMVVVTSSKPELEIWRNLRMRRAKLCAAVRPRKKGCGFAKNARKKYGGFCACAVAGITRDWVRWWCGWNDDRWCRDVAAAPWRSARNRQITFDVRSRGSRSSTAAPLSK